MYSAIVLHRYIFHCYGYQLYQLKKSYIPADFKNVVLHMRIIHIALS